MMPNLFPAKFRYRFEIETADCGDHWTAKIVGGKEVIVGKTESEVLVSSLVHIEVAVGMGLGDAVKNKYGVKDEPI